MIRAFEINETVAVTGSGVGVPVCGVAKTPQDVLGAFVGTASVPGFADRAIYVHIAGGEGGLMALLTAEDAAVLSVALAQVVASLGTPAAGQVLQ